MWVITSLVVLLLLLGHIAVLLPHVGAAAGRCLTEVLVNSGFLWTPASRGEEFPCFLYELVQSCMEKGFLMVLARARDCQSSPKLDYSNMVTFEMKSASIGVPAPAHYSAESVSIWVMPLLFVPCVVFWCFEVSGLIFHFLWCLTLLLSELC